MPDNRHSQENRGWEGQNIISHICPVFNGMANALARYDCLEFMVGKSSVVLLVIVWQLSAYLVSMAQVTSTVLDGKHRGRAPCLKNDPIERGNGDTQIPSSALQIFTQQGHITKAVEIRVTHQSVHVHCIFRPNRQPNLSFAPIIKCQRGSVALLYKSSRICLHMNHAWESRHPCEGRPTEVRALSCWTFSPQYVLK